MMQKLDEFKKIATPTEVVKCSQCFLPYS